MLKLIRKAIKDDIDSINLLGEQLHKNFTKTFHIDTEIENKNAIVLVALDNDEVIGYLYALNFVDNIDLLSIFVSNNKRCQHFGSKLMKHLINEVINQTITLEVSTKNNEAINLYKKYGFKGIGLRKNYYEDSDAVIMKWGN